MVTQVRAQVFNIFQKSLKFVERMPNVMRTHSQVSRWGWRKDHPVNPVRTRILGLSVVAIASLSLTACGGGDDTALASTNAASETPTTTVAGQTPATATSAPAL